MTAADAKLQALQPLSRREALHLAALRADAYVATAVLNGMSRAHIVGLGDHLVEQAIQHEVDQGIRDLNPPDEPQD